MPEPIVINHATATSQAAHPPPADAAARALALDVTQSFIIEAPAGSGKTGLLLQRYLKLLASPDIDQPEEILAATFTNKATNELRERVLRELQSASASATIEEPSPFKIATRDLASAVLTRDAERSWGLLTRPQRLNIRTIDSFCAEIARTLPLLSGSGAPRTPSADPDELYHLAAQRTLLQLGGDNLVLNRALQTVLLHRDGSLHDVETLLARMLQSREQWAQLIPSSLYDQAGSSAEIDAALEAGTRPRLERALNAIVCAGLTRAVEAMPPGFLAELTSLAVELSGEPGYRNEPSPIAICASRTMSPEAKSEHLEHWLVLLDLLLVKEGTWRKGFAINSVGFALPKTHKPRLEALVNSVREDETLREALCAVRCLPPPQYPDEQWAVAKALFHLLVAALQDLKHIFAERETCDFAELSLAARHALSDADGASDFSIALGSTLRHLLVDEMQDTSAAQYDLIERLTWSWDGGSQTLFLVGDPKQSIYAFRQARVERFLRTRREKRLGSIPLTCLDLTANFRSQARLVSAFNKDFDLIFPAKEVLDASSDTPLDVPFVNAEATRDADADCDQFWHTTVLGEDEATRTLDKAKWSSAHAKDEARNIRSIIECWRKKPPRTDKDGSLKPWKIAILAYARSHLKVIAQELSASDASRAAIPFRAIKVEPLDKRPEVLDALALTRALLHPADRTAWLAVLHAPWCGLSLVDLLTLAGNGERKAAELSLPAQIDAQLSAANTTLTPEGRVLLSRAWLVLSLALESRGRTTLATLVERTWRSLGGDAPLTAAQGKNVALYFALLRELEESGARVDLERLTERMSELYAEPQTGDPTAVDILTIHGAKGLEWDVVIVPGLERKGQSTSIQLLNWLERDSSSDAEAHVVLAPIHGKGEASDKLNDWLRTQRSAREAAERKRLFYVACTRAKEDLHLFAAATRNADGGLNPGSNSLLKAAWPTAQRAFNEAAPTAFVAGPSSLKAAMTASLDAMQPLTLAASGEDGADEKTVQHQQEAATAPPPLIHRLPLSFNPRARFAEAAAHSLSYKPAASTTASPIFDRPEGSYEARALGNVVHRYLQLLSERLAAGTGAPALQAEVDTWQPRLSASLRAEGLPPAEVRRAATIARRALRQTLADATGLWLLSPQAASANERSLRLAAESAGLRVDRSFVAAASPLQPGESHFWIVDFKTSAQSAAVPADFDETERRKYGAQLETYARAQREINADQQPIMLALYYPLLPRLIAWLAQS